MENLQVKDGITLDCDHRFCKTCISQHFITNIDEAKVDDDFIKCPQNCEVMIDVNILKEVLPNEKFERFVTFRVKQWKPIGEDAKEIDFKCPSPDCPNRIIIPLDLDTYTCLVCNQTRCPKCLDQVHKGNTCEAYRL